MADEGFKRKLTAVLSADAVGYSRLMAEDEAGTVRTLATYREVMISLIKQHRGRVVDSPGDNVLAEFSSVVDAVQCAVAVQNEIQTRNAELAENRRMEFRIGINLGDVIDEDDRIYGDGVNIAARLESLADPGGICVSKTAFDQIETKLPLGYEYLGEQSVKNIPKPVGAYRVLMKPDAAGKVIGEKRFLGRYSRRTAMAAIIILVIVAGGLIGWNIYLQQSKKVEPASADKMAYPLPDKPSIAVLPFVNMSGDPEQEYFSDGITEEIITALSKTPKMLVIARNSTFSYKGKSVKIKEVAEDLGVQYVLEGSVRKEGDRIRINAQLIDSITGHHLWAERYDRDLKDVFSLQDEITIKIITALQVNLTEGEWASISSLRTQNLEAYLKVLKAREYFMRLNQRDNTLAQRLTKDAIALDPEYPFPYALLGWTHWMDVWYRTSKSPKQSISRAFELAQKGLSMDPSLVNAHSLLAYIYTFKRRYEKAIAEAEQSLAINPNFADGHCHKARTLHYVGRNEDSIELYTKAMRLNPFPPSFYYYQLGYCYLMTEQYEQAVAELKKAIKLQPDNLPAFVGLAAVYGFSDQKEEAILAGKEVSRIAPEFSVGRWVKRLPYKNEADRDRLRSGLFKAGLPE
jgi:adenylate cyclase